MGGENGWIGVVRRARGSRLAFVGRRGLRLFFFLLDFFLSFFSSLL